MNHSTKGAFAATATRVLLLGGAGIFATFASGSAPDASSVGQQEWSNVLIALGLIGYAAALLVAAFGKRRPKHGRV